MQYPILWIVDPRLGTVVKYFKKALVCYHVVDNYSAAPYYSEKIREDLKQAEKFILPIADLVIVTSPFLQKEKSKFNSNVHLVKNAVDYEQFSIFQRSDNMPKDMEGISKPIIGYIGAINEKLDFELLAYIAHKRPQWSFVFIGDYVNNPELSESYKFIQQHPSNVFLLGKRDVKDVPRYIHACDVCIMPYCRNDYTKAIDSLKLYEYFACGKPVVATDISIAREYSQVVYIAKDGDDFIQKLEEVLVLFPSVRREIQRSIALQNTWDKRVEQLSLLIQAALRKLQVQK
ncbi:glycosyltransferase family 1 protein [Candidatus Brocadia pituitae]|nr:glycosyltransferase family 1 protein [Candidatus Brocadia pituitae]